MTNLARFYSRKKVHIILDLNDRAVCHVFVSKGARYYIIKMGRISSLMSVERRNLGGDGFSQCNGPCLIYLRIN